MSRMMRMIGLSAAGIVNMGIVVTMPIHNPSAAAGLLVLLYTVMLTLNFIKIAPSKFDFIPIIANSG